ncbi:phage tail tube protein [Roseibium sp. SCP14]|uniref:phage tail tube protein n=1 Tax=Roseibium sp. SCP14 TaxID=3141375 RepID=UPI0033354C8E
MATRKYRKLALLAKIEVSEATDSVPTGADNAIQANDVSITPMAGDEETRDLMLPYLGHQGVILTGDYVQLEFSVEVAGAGAAGTVPPYGALLRACALSETITPATSVAYEPVSDGEESISVYFNQDGVRHVALGARGNVTVEFVPKRIPRFRFTLMGLLGTITDVALPTIDLSGFQTPRTVSKAATTLSLHGASRVAESLSINLGQQIEPRFLIGDERIQLSDRSGTGTAIVEAEPLASVNWFDIASQRTAGVLQLVHGTVAGNIVQLDAPAVEIGRPTQGQTQGVVNYSLPLMLKPSAGNDELVITVK